MAIVGLIEKELPLRGGLRRCLHRRHAPVRPHNQVHRRPGVRVHVVGLLGGLTPGPRGRPSRRGAGPD
eukprot:4148025-Lingulodinium_polyedra.AAC.1